MKQNNIIQLIDEAATRALRHIYTDESAHIVIEGIHLIFNDIQDYKVTARCCINNIATIFELDSVVGLPTNPFDFDKNAIFAFAIHLANIAIKVYKANTEQESEILYDPSEPHGVC
jgi:hypothetical protein